MTFNGLTTIVKTRLYVIHFHKILKLKIKMRLYIFISFEEIAAADFYQLLSREVGIITMWIGKFPQN